MNNCNWAYTLWQWFLKHVNNWTVWIINNWTFKIEPVLKPVLPLSPGVPVADSGRGECVLPYWGVEQCTSAVCAVSPGPPGDGCFAPGVWGTSGWAVRERHDLSLLRLSCWTSATCHLTMQKRSKGQLIPF